MIDFLTSVNWVEIIQAALMIVGGLAILTKFTPTEADDKIVNSILQTLRRFAGK